MTVIKKPANVCQKCGFHIGPLEYEMVSDDEVHTVNYCSGCGVPVEEALSDE